MLCEEKDRLSEEYGVLHLSPEELAQLPEEAVLRTRKGTYSTEVLVRRQELPEKMAVSLRPLELEELFLLMIKGSANR